MTRLQRRGPDSPLVLNIINANQRRGAENVAGYLHEAFLKSDTRSLLVALMGSDTDRREDVSEVLRTRPGIPIIQTVWRLRQLIRRQRPSVILAHGFRSALAATLASARLGSSKPELVWHRILRLPRPPTDARYFLHRFVARRCAAVICITPYLSDETRQLGFPGEPTYIPNHRPMDFGSRGCDSAETNTRPFILFAGRLVSQKRPDRFLDVAEAILDRRDDYDFLIAGTGPLEAELKERVNDSPALMKSVRFLGHVDPLQPLLRSAECLALTSENESCPGVVVEAMMCGCRVVAFDVDGIRDLVGDFGGRIVPQGQLEEFVRSIEAEIGADPDPNANTAVKEHSAQFSTERLLRRYEDVLGLTP